MVTFASWPCTAILPPGPGLPAWTPDITEIAQFNCAPHRKPGYWNGLLTNGPFPCGKLFFHSWDLFTGLVHQRAAQVSWSAQAMPVPSATHWWWISSPPLWQHRKARENVIPKVTYWAKQASIPYFLFRHSELYTALCIFITPKNYWHNPKLVLIIKKKRKN